MSDDVLKIKALELAHQTPGTANETIARAHEYHAFLTGGKPVAGANKTATKPTTAPSGAAAQGGAPVQSTTKTPSTTKPAAGKPVAQAAPQKAPGGQHSFDQVKALLQKVIATPGLGAQRAKEILDEEAGAKKMSEVKPEKFDVLFEALSGALNSGEGGTPPASSDDDLLES
jgi:hypothetical protein